MEKKVARGNEGMVMMTPKAQRFVEMLHELELFACQYPELLDSPGGDGSTDLVLLLDYLRSHAAARAEIADFQRHDRSVS